MSQANSVTDELFATHSVESAPEKARPIVEATRSHFGFVPATVAKMATSPELLDGFMQANRLFKEATLSELEREVVVMTLATHVGCHYSVAMHTALLVRQKTPEDAVCSLRDAQPLTDERLEEIRVFTLAVIDAHGEVSREQLGRFLDPGYTPRNALEVVLGIGTYTIGTYANRLTAAQLDEPFAPYRWTPKH
jgi:alkylhydroperoxidase family enzyme